MGKRRRPTRKPNYQSLEEIAEQQGIGAVPQDMRMAGDEIIKELVEERSEEQKQVKHLARQLGRFAENDTMFEQAGVPYQMIDNLQSIRQLSNGVPAPYIDTVSKPGIERRIHTGVGVNPYTGDREIVPFMNKGTGEALVTEFGTNVNMEGQDKASEYVQDHILRLMGHNPQRGPTGKIDFYVDIDGQRVGIDGQALGAGERPVVEAYTKAIPTGRNYGYGYGRQGDRSIKTDMKRLIDSELRQGNTFDEAMSNLVSSGRVRNDRHLAGKLYKADYDEVLMPIQNQTMHRANQRNDVIAIAPDDVIGYNLHDIREDINNIRDGRQLQYTYNAGMDGRGEARTRIRGYVPQEAIVNVVDSNPYVAQILSNIER